MKIVPMNFAKLILISSVFVFSPISAAQISNGSIEKDLIDTIDALIRLNFIVLKDKKDEEVIKLAQDDVIEELIDPDSANFRNEKIIRNNDGLYVCGEVNAKNSFGGYVGFKPYFSAIVGPPSHILTDYEDSVTNTVVLYYCFE